VTQALNLGVGLDAIRRRLSKGHRSAISKAQRSGVTVRRAETMKDWRRYFELYQLSLGRWGARATSRYDWRLFEMLEALSPNVQLWLADLDGSSVAGAVLARGGEHVGYWHGAAAESAFPARPVHLLLWTVIEQAVQTGALWFDFLPSGGHLGVEAFKRSFGAVDIPLLRIDTGDGKESALSRIRAAASWLPRRAANLQRSRFFEVVKGPDT
jgi:lipid II:glycine glycyltransferase (peptidoglycan interpeptide bridge formation enzyme)